MSSNAKKPSDPVLDQLDQIKRLLVVQLLRDGVNQDQIAGALDIGQSSVSRMMAAYTKASVSKKPNT